jgi:hypothetical protein
MAIYHCSVTVTSRSSGASSVAAVAYREGEKITDERTGLIHDYQSYANFGGMEKLRSLYHRPKIKSKRAFY